MASPGHWRGDDILKLSGILAGSVFLFTVDGELNSWIGKHQSSASTNISRAFSTLGNGYFLGSVLAGLYISGEIGDNNNLRKIALLSLESWLLSGAIVSAGKFVFGRARPYRQEGSLSFHPFSLKSGFFSLPSGHAASVFAVAAVMDHQSKELFFDFIAYSLATVVSLSRVYDNKHWPSDVFLGAAVGYAVAHKVLSLNKKREGKKLSVYFKFSSLQQSITFSLDF